MRAMLDGLVSWTTDLGTEAGFADCLADGFWERLGGQVRQTALRMDNGNGDELGDASPGPSSTLTIFLFRRAILIPRMCHMIDNLTHDAHTHAMQSWTRFKAS